MISDIVTCYVVLSSLLSVIWEIITFGVSFLELFRKVPPLVARGGTFLKSSKFDGQFQNHVVAKGKKDVGE